MDDDSPVLMARDLLMAIAFGALQLVEVGIGLALVIAPVLAVYTLIQYLG